MASHARRNSVSRQTQQSTSCPAILCGSTVLHTGFNTLLLLLLLLLLLETEEFTVLKVPK
jgi:hypothetical protein